MYMSCYLEKVQNFQVNTFWDSSSLLLLQFPIFFKIVFSVFFHAQKDAGLYKLKNLGIKLYPPVYLHSQVNSRLTKQEEKLSWPIPALSRAASISVCTEDAANEVKVTTRL